METLVLQIHRIADEDKKERRVGERAVTEAGAHGDCPDRLEA